MTDYNGIYVDKLVKLFEKYYNDFVSFSNNKYDNDKCLRMEEVLNNILNYTYKKYIKEYDLILERYTYDLEEELLKLNDLLSLIDKRNAFVNDYLQKYEEVTSKNMEELLNKFVITEQKNNILHKIEVINSYNERMLKLKKLEEDNNNGILEKEKLDLLMHKYSTDNRNKDMEFNKSVNRLLVEYGVYNINKDDVLNYYPKYLELYEKAKEQRNMGYNEVSSIYDMAFENYSSYNFKYQLLELSDVIKPICFSYEEILQKRDMINVILKNIGNHQITDKINDLMQKEVEYFDEQRDTIDKLKEIEQNITNSKKMIREILLQNEDKKVRKIIEQFILNEDYVTKGEKKPLNEVTPNMIVSIESSPLWLKNEIKKNEYKFYNWFNKINNLIVKQN